MHLDVTDTIEAVRAKYDGKLEAGEETEDMVGIAGRVLFLRNAGGLCFVQLSAGDGTKIQGMISKKEIGADSLKQFKQLVDLGDHLYLKGRVIASRPASCPYSPLSGLSPLRPCSRCRPCTRT